MDSHSNNSFYRAKEKKNTTIYFYRIGRLSSMIEENKFKPGNFITIFTSKTEKNQEEEGEEEEKKEEEKENINGKHKLVGRREPRPSMHFCPRPFLAIFTSACPLQ